MTYNFFYVLTLLVTEGHAKERSLRDRRVSVSSTEDNVDLEASLASLWQQHTTIPVSVREDGEVSPSPGPSKPRRPAMSRSKSPGTARTIANRLANSIASLTSPTAPSKSLPGGDTIWTAKSNYAMDTQLLFKRRITNLYVQVSALKSYVELNYSGFRKILKKCVYASRVLLC